MDHGPSELDIVFGRAVLAFRMVSKPQLDECLKIQRQFQAVGQSQALAQIIVKRGLVDRDGYQRIVDEIRRRYVQRPEPIEATSALPPELTTSGRYAPRATPTILAAVHEEAPPTLGDEDNPGNKGAEDGIRTMNIAVPWFPGSGAAPPPPNKVPRTAETAAESAPSAKPPTPAPGPAATFNRTQMAPPPSPPPLSPFPSPSPFPQGAPLAAGPKSPGEEVKSAADRWESALETGTGWEVVSDAEPETLKPLPDALASSKKAKRRDANILKMLELPEDVGSFTLGTYTVIELVAAGGMGVIYRARSPSGEIHALKALLNVEKATEKQLKRFTEEGRLMLKLSHPNIVRVYESSTYKGVPYFTMDFLEGSDLHDVLRLNALDLKGFITILAKTCRAVGHAHTQGIIHRDLKPSNIVIRRSDGEPILTDFGLAKNLESEFKLTAEGAMVGTPLYLSPEQVAGRAHEADAKVDVYGLGVMLYQICAGRLPFTGKNPYDIYKKILSEDPKKPTELVPTLAPDLDKIIFKAIAKDPDERYETATAMAEDIERYLRGEPVKAVPPPPGRRYKKRKSKKSEGVDPAELDEKPEPSAPAQSEDAPKAESGRGSQLGLVIALLIVFATIGYAVYTVVIG